jgi:hypothetical protein
MAQERFYNRHWRCEEQDEHGSHCVNVASCHDKGHQNARGKVFSKGRYQSYYEQHKEEAKDGFLAGVYAHLDVLLKAKVEGMERQRRDGDEKEEIELISELHRNKTLQMYTEVWGADCVREIATRNTGHSTCLSCLASVPIHALKCGHLICEDCLVAYSKAASGARRAISICPLCCNMDNPWRPARMIAIKPPTAGLRILSLDGFVRSPSCRTLLIESE